MRLSVSTQFTLKDRPKDYLGLYSEHWNFGKDEYISLSSLVFGFLKVAMSYYARFEESDTLDVEIEKVLSLLYALNERHPVSDQKRESMALDARISFE